MSIDDANADVTLTCEGRSMKCHHTVLAMYSSVFQSMLGPKAAAEFKFLVLISVFSTDSTLSGFKFGWALIRLFPVPN